MEAKTKHITVCVTPTTYTRARIWAAERNVSLSAIVQLFLTDLPNLRSLRNFSKDNLPRKVRTPRKAAVYIKIEAPADSLLRTIPPKSQFPQPCIPVAAPLANPSPATDAALPASS
jgi:hypothetical protein